MKNKELIEELKKCNPEAEVSVITYNRQYKFSLAWGGGGEGCEKENAPEVSFYVDETCGKPERTKNK